MAVVYKARDTRLKRWVALKVFNLGRWATRFFRRRLIKEAQWPLR